MAQQALHAAPPASEAGIDWLGTIRGIIVEPLTTFRRLADAQPWRQGLALFFVALACRFVVHLVFPTKISASADTAQAVRLAETINSPLVQIFALLVVTPLMFLAFTGLIYQIGLRQGGDGPFARLFTTEVFNVAIVMLVTTPINALAALLNRSNIALGPVVSAISIGGLIWGVVLTVLSLRASMRLSTGSAIGVIAGTIVAAIFFLAMAFCLLAAVFRAL